MPNNQLFPNAASNFAGQFDDLFWVLTLLSVFFTVLVLSMMIFFAIRYRAGSKVDRSNPVDHNRKVEFALIGILLIIGLGVFFWSARPFASIYGEAPANALNIYVIGKQWMWHIQHPDGIRENDALHIPVGRPVKLTMISQDVIHSFFVPAFRIKRDVVPGMYTSVWFIPTKVGKYHLFCAQYCGADHSQMTGWVTVMKPQDYAAWEASGGETPTTPRSTMEATGEQIFNNLACVSCHGFAPARAPALVGLYGQPVKLTDGRTVIADDAYIRESILYPDAKVVEGYQPIMPPFKDQLSEEQVLDLIAFLKSLGSENTGIKPAVNADNSIGRMIQKQHGKLK
jgi:cytochrome c oxidase subunit 2